jgi:hypothetical protein
MIIYLRLNSLFFNVILPEDENICRDHFIAGQVDQITDPNISPQAFAISAQ